MGEASRFASSTRATRKRFAYYGDAYAPNGELGNARRIFRTAMTSRVALLLVDSDVLAVGYPPPLLVDGLYGSACKESGPFSGSNSGSLWIRTAEVS